MMANKLMEVLHIKGDSPTVPQTGNHQNTHEPFSNGPIPRSVRRLGLLPNAVSGQAEQQERQDEMDLRILLKKPNLVARVDLGLHDHFSLPVHPLLSEGDARYEAFKRYGGSTLAFVSRIFTFWRGSLDFKIEFVTSMFSTGRYSATWIPTITTDPTTDPQLLMAYPSIVMDLHESRSFQFTIPYISELRAKRIPTRIQSGGQWLLDYASVNGELVIHALNPIQTPTPASQDKWMWVWMRAGQDFELCVPDSISDYVTMTDDIDAEGATTDNA